MYTEVTVFETVAVMVAVVGFNTVAVVGFNTVVVCKETVVCNEVSVVGIATVVVTGDAVIMIPAAPAKIMMMTAAKIAINTFCFNLDSARSIA